MSPEEDQIAEEHRWRDLALRACLLDGVLDATAEIMAACDEHGVLMFFNRAARQLVVGEPEQVGPEERPRLYRVYRADGTLMDPDGLSLMRALREPLMRALGEANADNLEVLVDGLGGGRRHLTGVGRRLSLDDGTVVGAVVVLRDVTDERAALDQLREQGLRDPITGLASRRLLQDHLVQALRRAERSGATTALIAIDIDGFRQLNDTFGHDVGDAVLVEVGRRLESALRGYDTVARSHTVARLDGDEFFVLCEDVKGEGAASSIVARLIEAIAAPMELDGQALAVTVGVGIVLRQGRADDPEELIHDAEVAMRQAKAQGRGGRVCFSEEMGAAARRLGETEASLERALTNGEFRLVYQPKILLATGQITGVEALLRWEHPERGTVSPLEFIPLAERSGQIVPIGAWVLEQACAQAAAWAQAFPSRPPVQVSVNVSARQFDTDIVGAVVAALDAARLGHGLLCVELTESIVMRDADAAVAVLEDLKAVGVSISIDDFGTGYSSLSYLRRLPLDEIKVDKSFVDGLGADPESTAIVAAVIAMAHALDRVVVAEGVETAAQLQELTTLGCDYAQGYYFARPQTAEDLEVLLVAEAERTWDGHQAGRGEADTRSSYRSRKVVVADDTPTVLQLARLSLTTAGFEVHEATTGREALALVAEVSPECVILDVMMPDMDGFEVCRALRANLASVDCTIVMLTATSSPDSKAVAFLAGADDYIVKPFAPRDLVSRVRAAMSRRMPSGA
ncbi:MAG TPA: EAL domain-containing protein [Acidimicrobiales bacterium]|nr:EAL domain-containing protein [Acidimicrobiales bacterium]